MPAQVSELEIMEEDQIIEEVLDKFVNCHEQTYEEFLSTFTHLSKGDNVTKRGALGTNSSENILTSTQYTHANEPNNLCLRNKAIVLCTSSQFSEEEQIVLDEGQNVGSSFQGDLKRAGKVKVDNFLAMEDLAVDGEVADRVSTDWLLLPGEVEQDVIPSVPYVPSSAQPRTPEGQCRPTVKGVDGQRDEILGDEVQPFRLDPEFDYDTVTLTPKLTPEEIDAIKELSKQTQGNPDPDLEEPRG